MHQGKIGAIEFERELELLAHIRRHFSAADIELRVDANGAFSPKDALRKLTQLNEFQLHSIEQPVRAGQWEVMKELCATSPFPIALDEELIGVNETERKIQLLDTIRPHYIILKPSLHGGIQGSKEWITLAQERGIGYWVTSALESNIGLNAIAQWCATLQPEMPQGLGTGMLSPTTLTTRCTLKATVCGSILKKRHPISRLICKPSDMSATPFITEIARQSILIDGKCYTAHEVRISEGESQSLLQNDSMRNMEQTAFRPHLPIS